MRIGVYLFDGAEELDWAGPWEVLAAWADQYPDDGVEVFTLARASREVRCAKGLQVRADFTWNDVPAMDVLVYPGGRATRNHLGDVEVRQWLRALADGGTLMTSVCTGALVLADAGLLDGAPATTHWADLDELAALGEGDTGAWERAVHRQRPRDHRRRGVRRHRHGAPPGRQAPVPWP